MPLLFGPSVASFPELKLNPVPANRVLVFDIAPLQSLLERNGLSPDTLHQLSQEALRDLLLVWYIEHTSRGGQCNPEIRAAVRELLDPNPAARLELRPALLSPLPSTAARQPSPHAAPQTFPERFWTRLRHSWATVAAYFLGGEDVVPVEYKVPAGPAIHLRPSNRSRAV